MNKCLNEYVKHDDFYELRVTRNNGEAVQGFFDIEDYDLIKKYHWHVQTPKGKYYFSTKIGDKEVFLHKLIMDDSEKIVDHIDGNSLNNRRTNLRYCNSKQNAQNLKQHRSKTGIIGVRKDTRCKNSYRAQIYFSQTEHIEKTFKNIEYAIIQRLCWELMYFGEFAPQINLIKKEYPFLLGYEKVKDKMVFSTDIQNIYEIGKCLLDDPHCPCMPLKNENTLCPCLPCRNKHHCCCGLFVPITEDSNLLKTKYPDRYQEWLNMLSEE